MLNKMTAVLALTLFAAGTAVAGGFSMGPVRASAPGDTPTTKADAVVGMWEGIAKNTPRGDSPFTMELRNEGGKVAGHIKSPDGSFHAKEGTFADGKLSVTFSNMEGVAVTVLATVKEDTISGTWSAGSNGGAFECKKVTGASAPQ
jgi:hypothetical protein